MDAGSRQPLTGDLLRMALASAVVVLIAGAALGWPYAMGFYHAGRAARRIQTEGWAPTDQLHRLGPKAGPGCRWAYRHASDRLTRVAMARTLGYAAGADVLLELVRREGPDSAAEEALIQVLADRRPPKGAEVLRDARLAGLEGSDGDTRREPDLHYRFDTYEVKVWDRGRSGYNCTVTRLGPVPKASSFSVHYGS
jgi:hypothetical protein